MRYFLLLLPLVYLGCQTKQEVPTSNEILTESINTHDPNGKWATANFGVYIQEPRIGNAKRYSEVKLNNSEDSFKLKRNRDENVSTHVVDKQGVSITYLNDKIETDSIVINKYRLNPDRNKGYQRFYKVLLGLPMSLNNNQIKVDNKVEESIFNKEKAYKLSFVFDEPLFSKHWNVFFSKETKEIIGLEMIFPEDPTKGERLIFEEQFIINDSIVIPRIRHWKELNGKYSGSDIIIEKLEPQ